MDNVCELATSLIFCNDITKIVRDSYSETLIDHINMAEIRATAENMTYQNCKVVLSGKNAIKMIEGLNFKTIKPA